MQAEDIRIFMDNLTHYFAQLGEGPATIRTAYLEPREEIQSSDYSAAIELSGAWKGHVIVAAPCRLVRYLLRSQKENDDDPAMYLDAIGELANTLAGNARRHFGAELEIGLPATWQGPAQIEWHGQRPYLIELTWKHYTLQVLIDLKPG